MLSIARAISSSTTQPHPSMYIDYCRPLNYYRPLNIDYCRPQAPQLLQTPQPL